MPDDVQVFVTGVEEIDKILRTMEDKEIKKAVTRATKDTIRSYVLPTYKAAITAAGFVDTGATRDIAEPRAIKRSRLQYGYELWIDRKAVVALRRARFGRIGYDKKRGEDFFHPVAIEFGTKTVNAEHPLLRSLLGNTGRTLAQFHKWLKVALTEINDRAVTKGVAKFSRMSAALKKIDAQ